MKRNRLTRLEKAWLAGFIDGEGCIVIKSYKWHQLWLLMGQKNRKILDYINKIVGCGSMNFAKHKKAWRLEIVSNEATCLLKQLLPHLKIKKLEAQIAIQFQENKMECRGKRGGIPQKELIWREMHKQLLQHIKKRRYNAQ